ncbi:hypothetical protein TKK_0015287 [Trichogramma kaykai]
MRLIEETKNRNSRRQQRHSRGTYANALRGSSDRAKRTSPVQNNAMPTQQQMTIDSRNTYPMLVTDNYSSTTNLDNTAEHSTAVSDQPTREVYFTKVIDERINDSINNKVDYK